MTQRKRQYGSTLALFLLGALALYGGKGWLLLVIPVGALVWYGSLARGRN